LKNLLSFTRNINIIRIIKQWKVHLDNAIRPVIKNR